MFHAVSASVCGATTGYNSWCKSMADRWATSIINSKARKLYLELDGKKGGLVLAPTAQLFCAYAEALRALAHAHIGLAASA